MGPRGQNRRRCAVTTVYDDPDPADGHLHRADDLAAGLAVSVRTIYRDMETLVASGVPVAGTRGAGYHRPRRVTLPPLNLSEAELEALHVGLAAVGRRRPRRVAGRAESLSAKIDAVLPEDRDERAARLRLSPPSVRGRRLRLCHMPAMRAAIRSRQKLRLTWRWSTAASDRGSARCRRTTGGGCGPAPGRDDRGAFEVFRVDRIDTLSCCPGCSSTNTARRRLARFHLSTPGARGPPPACGPPAGARGRPADCPHGRPPPPVRREHETAVAPQHQPERRARLAAGTRSAPSP